MSFQIPIAPRRAKKIQLHGDIRTDPYFWLREKENPETMKYLKSENKYFEQAMGPLQKTQDKLFKEMKARIQENESSAPAPYGPFLYYTRFKMGLQYPLECRKPRKGGREQVVLDQNSLAKGKKYFHSTGYAVSPNHTKALYSVDFDGSERYHVQVRDLKTGKTIRGTPKRQSSGSFAWAADSETFFYVVQDANLRPYQVYRHRLGSSAAKDELVFEEKDPQHFLSVSLSSSEDYIFLETSGKITSEIWYLSTHDPMGAFQCIEKRKEGIEYQVDHRESEFWILTNWKARNFQVMRAPSKNPQRRFWKTFYQNSDQIYREEINLFKNFLVVSEQKNGLPQVRVHDFAMKKDHLVAFEDAAYTVGVTGDNLEFDTEILRLSYSSPITPPSVLDYNMRTKRTHVAKVKQVKGHVKAHYRCERVWVKSHDGAQVPMTLVYRKGLKKEGTAPGYLYGYGSYGMSMPDAFPSYRDLYRLIDRGFVYALAHIRGGSEMGRHWYEDGKFLKKKNTFHDFIACAKYLKKKSWIDAKKLAICGGSAGGMLMGACMNMRPDLFKVVIAHVPFVDVVNTMLDKSLPLTQLEYNEWGNPSDKKYYRYIKSYSPYDNVEAKDYPHLFVTCGLNDPRVTYWEPAKWVAKLRELKTDSNPILFKTNMGAGHFGVSGRFDHLHENAAEYAFILSVFGIKA